MLVDKALGDEKLITTTTFVDTVSRPKIAVTESLSTADETLSVARTVNNVNAVRELVLQGVPEK